MSAPTSQASRAGTGWCEGGGSGPCFRAIADFPEDVFEMYVSAISDDGLAVAGDYWGKKDQQAYFASPAGLITLDVGGSAARGISGDGQVIVGVTEFFFDSVAVRWTSPDPDDMEWLDPQMEQLGKQSNAYDGSGDGSVIVGSGPVIGGYRWTESTGAVDLGDLPGGSNSSNARAVSEDGSVVVGSSSATLGTEAFRWTQTGGMQSIGELAGGTHSSTALATSSDGNVIVGYSNSTNGQEAFVWTQADGIIGLGDLPGGTFSSRALAVSPGGRVIVGQGRDAEGTAAFYWVDCLGMVELRQMLIDEFGLGDELAGWTLERATGVSRDGLTIVGNGENPDGFQQPWVARIPYLPGALPCPADLMPAGGDGQVGIADITAVISAFGPCPGCPEDFVPDGGDGEVSVADVIATITAFGPCTCP